MKLPILSFNAGELSPQVDARSDVNKYRSGCRILENMIPRVYGGAERRPGFKYIANNYNSAYNSKLIAFEYSDAITYLLEFNHLTISIYYDGTLIETIDSPYDISDIYELQCKQLNDVMWITHSDYAPRKLTRTSTTTFSLATITFTRGPFLPRNDLENGDNVTMTSSVTTGTGTLTCSTDIFEEGHVGALFKLTHARALNSLAGSFSNNGTFGQILVEGPWHFNTQGQWDAKIDITRKERYADAESYRSFNSSLQGNSSGRNIQLAAVEYEDYVHYGWIVSEYASGKGEVDITVDTPTQDGIVRIDSIVSSKVANITVLKAPASTDATKRWYEGAFSGVQGYPRSVTFYEDRCIYASTPSQPQTIWFSATGDYENHGTPIVLKASSPFFLTMAAEKRNSIRWVSALDSLIIGTIGGEWILSTTNNEPLDPTSINYKLDQQTAHGSKILPALAVGDVLLFVDKVGRKVREIAWTEERQKYVAPDLSSLAEHITKSGITSMAYQRHPDNILWLTLDDGTLLSMTYEREQDVVAWSKHPLGGTDAKAESVAVLSGTDEDEIWISSSRTVDGSTVRFIEQMQPRDWGDDQADCFFLDAAVVYEAS